jgi:hypothetical protein
VSRVMLPPRAGVSPTAAHMGETTHADRNALRMLPTHVG